jgi:hypothetical protein
MPCSILIIAATFALPGATRAGQATEGFPDVPKTHWAYAAVTDLKARGILVGYPPQPRAARQAPTAKRPPADRTADRRKPVRRRGR